MYSIKVILIGNIKPDLANKQVMSDYDHTYLFTRSIEKIIRDANIIPVTGDRIHPYKLIGNPDQFGTVRKRYLDPNCATITYKIEPNHL